MRVKTILLHTGLMRSSDRRHSTGSRFTITIDQKKNIYILKWNRIHCTSGITHDMHVVVTYELCTVRHTVCRVNVTLGIGFIVHSHSTTLLYTCLSCVWCLISSLLGVRYVVPEWGRPRTVFLETRYGRSTQPMASRPSDLSTNHNPRQIIRQRRCWRTRLQVNTRNKYLVIKQKEDRDCLKTK